MFLTKIACRRFWILLSVLLLFFLITTLGHAEDTETTLMVSTNAAAFGTPVTLTATVLPSTATGKVTFYDGTTVLGVSTLNGGSATLQTSLLHTGMRSLQAYYGGKLDFDPSWSYPVTLSVFTEPANGFQQAGNYTVNYPQEVAVADFNGDGNSDLVIAGAWVVKVMLGNGDGTFQTAIDTSGFGNPSIAVADFTSDGKTDLVIANFTSGRVETRVGQGDGSFEYYGQYFDADQFPYSLAGGDFKLDGNVDLVVGCGFLNTFAWWGNGNGSFYKGESGITADVHSVAVGDFNKDGNTDAVVTDVRNELDRVAILLGNGYGNFTEIVSCDAGNHPQSVAVEDFNGDDNADLVVANAYSDDVSILLGNGDGTFQAAVNYSVGEGPQWVAVEDFNGDDNADLVVANGYSDDVSILLGNGDGTFQAAVNHSVGDHPVAVAVGEFNGDGRADLVVANANSDDVRVLLGIVDSTPPIILANITGTLGLNGWYRSNVTVTWSVTDAESGIASSTGCDPTSLTTDTAGETLMCSATNGAGLSASLPTTLKIDMTPPLVTYTGNAYTYTIEQTVNITCSASDNLSGVASTTCTDINGPAYSFSPGQNTFSASATDNAGNIGNNTTSFTVQVTFPSLCALTRQFTSKKGISTSLCRILDQAAKATASGNLNAKAGLISAYIYEVQSQIGKALTADQANVLISLAGALNL